MLLRGAVLCACAAGCYGDGWDYTCTTAEQCGDSAICSDGRCAFADTSCTSGYRFATPQTTSSMWTNVTGWSTAKGCPDRYGNIIVDPGWSY